MRWIGEIPVRPCLTGYEKSGQALCLWVKIWFQNRRTKWKKQENISNAEVAEHKLNAEKNMAKAKNRKNPDPPRPHDPTHHINFEPRDVLGHIASLTPRAVVNFNGNGHTGVLDIPRLPATMTANMGYIGIAENHAHHQKARGIVTPSFESAQDLSMKDKRSPTRVGSPGSDPDKVAHHTNSATCSSSPSSSSPSLSPNLPTSSFPSKPLNSTSGFHLSRFLGPDTDTENNSSPHPVESIGRNPYSKNQNHQLSIVPEKTTTSKFNPDSRPIGGPCQDLKVTNLINGSESSTPKMEPDVFEKRLDDYSEENEDRYNEEDDNDPTQLKENRLRAESCSQSELTPNRRDDDSVINHGINICVHNETRPGQETCGDCDEHEDDDDEDSIIDCQN